MRTPRTLPSLSLTKVSVVYYITSVLQLNVGLDRNLSLLLGGVINMMFFFGSLYPTFTLDKTGRRKPMMWGSFGCGFSMLMISILLSFQMRGQTDPVAKATSSASVAFFFTVSHSGPVRNSSSTTIGRSDLLHICTHGFCRSTSGTPADVPS